MNIYQRQHLKIFSYFKRYITTLPNKHQTDAVKSNPWIRENITHTVNNRHLQHLLQIFETQTVKKETDQYSLIELWKSATENDFQECAKAMNMLYNAGIPMSDPLIPSILLNLCIQYHWDLEGLQLLQYYQGWLRSPPFMTDILLFMKDALANLFKTFFAARDNWQIQLDPQIYELIILGGCLFSRPNRFINHRKKNRFSNCHLLQKIELNDTHTQMTSEKVPMTLCNTTHITHKTDTNLNPEVISNNQTQKNKNESEYTTSTKEMKSENLVGSLYNIQQHILDSLILYDDARLFGIRQTLSVHYFQLKLTLQEFLNLSTDLISAWNQFINCQNKINIPLAKKGATFVKALLNEEETSTLESCEKTNLQHLSAIRLLSLCVLIHEQIFIDYPFHINLPMHAQRKMPVRVQRLLLRFYKILLALPENLRQLASISYQTPTMRSWVTESFFGDNILSSNGLQNATKWIKTEILI